MYRIVISFPVACLPSWRVMSSECHARSPPHPRSRCGDASQLVQRCVWFCEVAYKLAIPVLSSPQCLVLATALVANSSKRCTPPHRRTSATNSSTSHYQPYLVAIQTSHEPHSKFHRRADSFTLKRYHQRVYPRQPSVLASSTGVPGPPHLEVEMPPLRNVFVAPPV